MKPKDATKAIAIYLPEADLAFIDDLCEDAVKGIDGAQLTRSAWAKAVVKRRLATLRAERAAELEAPAEQAPAPIEDHPAKQKRAAAGGKA